MEFLTLALSMTALIFSVFSLRRAAPPSLPEPKMKMDESARLLRLEAQLRIDRDQFDARVEAYLRQGGRP